MSDLKLTGLVIGDIYPNKKRTGFMVKIVVNRPTGAKLYTVFSKNPSVLKADEKGQLTVAVDVQDFVFATEGQETSQVSV